MICKSLRPETGFLQETRFLNFHLGFRIAIYRYELMQLCTKAAATTNTQYSAVEPVLILRLGLLTEIAQARSGKNNCTLPIIM
jgi:hypothetical protein